MATVAQILLRYREEFANVPEDVKRKLLDIGKSAKKSMAEAKDATDLLKDSLGVQLPRELTKLIAQSKLLGPALAASFNAAAVLGFVAAAQQLPELFNKISAAVTGWDDAQKKAYSDFLEQNQKALEGAEKFRLKMIEIQKGTGAALDAKVKDLQEATAQLQRAATATQNASQPSLTDQILRASTFGLLGGNKQNPEAARLQELANKSADQLRAAQQEVTANNAVELKKRLEDEKKHQEDLKTLRDKAEDSWFKYQMTLRKLNQDRLDAQMKDEQEAGDLFIKLQEERAKGAEYWEQQLLDFRNRTSSGGESVKAGLEEADRTAKRVGESMKESAHAAQVAFKDAFDSIKQTANRAFLDIFQNIHSGFAGLADVIKGIFRTLAAEILSTMTAQLFTPLLMGLNRSVFGGGLGNAALTGGGAAIGGSLLGGGLGSALGIQSFSGTGLGLTGGGLTGALGLGGGAGLLGLGAATIPVFGAAAIGAIAWLKSQAHHEANTFVQGFQNPFGAGLAGIVDAFNMQKNAGTLTAAGGAAAISQVQSLWNQFTTEAEKFASHGSDEARVVSQAHAQLDPLLKQILQDMHDALQNLPGGKNAIPQPAVVTFMLDRKTIGKIVLEDINTLIRGQGYILQPAR